MHMQVHIHPRVHLCVLAEQETWSKRKCCLLSLLLLETVPTVWLFTVMPSGSWSKEKAPRCTISAATRYPTATAVFVPRGHKVLPSCLLTCLLITKGHPAGTQRWPLDAEGYSIKTKARGKEEVIRRGEGRMAVPRYRLQQSYSQPPHLFYYIIVLLHWGWF